MADSPPHPDTGNDTGVGPDRESTTGTPRWVKVFGIIALGLVVLFFILRLAGVGGGHGPGRHAASPDAAGGRTPPSGVTEDHAPPEGGRGRP